MTIGLDNAADFDGRDANAFEAETLEHQHRRQVLAAAFAAQYGAAVLAGPVGRKIKKAFGDALAIGTRTGVDHVDDGDSVIWRWGVPIDVGEFWRLDLVENDHAGDIAVIVTHIEDAVVGGIGQPFDAREDATLIDGVRLVLFLILKMFVKQ